MLRTRVKLTLIAFAGLTVTAFAENFWSTIPPTVDDLTQEKQPARVLFLQVDPGIAGKLTTKGLVIEGHGVNEYKVLLQVGFTDQVISFNKKISIRYRADQGKLKEKEWGYLNPRLFVTLMSSEDLAEIFGIGNQFVVFEISNGDISKRLKFEIDETRELKQFREMLSMFFEKNGEIEDFGEYAREGNYWDNN